MKPVRCPSPGSSTAFVRRTSLALGPVWRISRTLRQAYRLNFWASLPHYVHFIVEKDAVAGTLSPVTREYDVALSPIRGYSSLSFAHEIASTWNRIGKPIFCYFLGDFDPSGFDLRHDIREKLKRYCNVQLWLGPEIDEGPDGCDWYREHLDKRCVLFRRIAVVEDDFEEFDLLALAVKEKDKRTRKFREQYGDRCAGLRRHP